METKERPKIEFKTKNGHVIVVKEYITGREANEIQGSYLKNAKVKIVNGAPQIDDFDVTADDKAKRLMIELMIISVDGNTEGVTDAVLDLNNIDYEEVVEKLNELTGKKKSE